MSYEYQVPCEFGIVTIKPNPTINEKLDSVLEKLELLERKLCEIESFADSIDACVHRME